MFMFSEPRHLLLMLDFIDLSVSSRVLFSCDVDFCGWGAFIIAEVSKVGDTARSKAIELRFPVKRSSFDAKCPSPPVEDVDNVRVRPFHFRIRLLV